MRLSRQCFNISLPRLLMSIAAVHAIANAKTSNLLAARASERYLRGVMEIA